MKLFRRWSLFLLPLLLATLFWGCETTQPATTTPARGTRPPATDGATVNLTILHVNDFHGQLLPLKATWRNASNPPDIGGVVTLGRYVEKFRAENPGRTLLLNAGDWYQGTPEGNDSKGRSVVDCFNLLNFDAAVLGNHEFDFGMENVQALVRAATFPVLCNNLEDSRTHARPDWLPVEYVQKDLDGVRVIIFGLLTKETEQNTSEELRTRYTLGDPVQATRLAVAQLRGKCDILIALSHCGLEVDKELARQFPELNVIVGGHTHTTLDKPYYDLGSRVIVVQAGAKGQYLGKLDLQFDRATRKLTGYEGSLVELDPGAPGLPAANADLKRKVEEWSSGIALRMNEVLGTVAAPVTRDRVADAPLASSALGNWVCDMMRAKTGAELAFFNRTGLRANLAAGNLTVRSLFEACPFDNTIVTVRMVGAQLTQLLEYAFSKDMYFLEGSGFTCKYTTGPRVGERHVSEILVNNRTVHPERIYTIATNSFIAGGGDGHATFRAGFDTRDTGIKIRELLEEMVKLQRGIPVVPTDNRFVEVPR